MCRHQFMHLCFFFLGKSKEAEIKRINKELANIRSKFKGKCVWPHEMFCCEFYIGGT